MEMDRNVRTVPRGDCFRGNDRKDIIFSKYEEMIGKWLRENNEFGLSEAVIQNYLSRNMPDLVRQAETALRGYQAAAAELRRIIASM